MARVRPLTERVQAPFIDATRLSDGAIVAIKRIAKTKHPLEVEITKILSSDPLRSNPTNHCIPVLDVLQSPQRQDIVLVVLPFLCAWNEPRFRTFGEVIECIRQLIEVARNSFDYVDATHSLRRVSNTSIDTILLTGENLLCL